MTQNPLVQIEALGQSIWLDYINRDLFSSGKLKKLITEDHLRGMTSNPTIFEKSISGSQDYDEDIHRWIEQGKSLEEIYMALTEKDVLSAADLFQNVYQKTEGHDGFVSIEVNPHFARDTQKTIQEARRLWMTLDRPNLLIKIPGTQEGLLAIQQLISEGININVTLLFSVPRYQDVIEAYLKGLETRLAQNQPIHQITSVASFFISRIDVVLDPIFEKHIQEKSPLAKPAEKLQGQIAIASAKKAYLIHDKIFNSPRFQTLKQQGAQIQRLLWASTSTKNPKYSDIKYIEALIGPSTINTMPLETLVSYREHGQPQSRLNVELNHAETDLQHLHEFGIDLAQITQQLEDEGVEKFSKSYDQLMAALKGKC